jgi:hypothetical protein
LNKKNYIATKTLESSYSSIDLIKASFGVKLNQVYKKLIITKEGASWFIRIVAPLKICKDSSSPLVIVKTT